MVTVEYLNQVRRLNLMIQNNLIELEMLKTMATSITAPTDKESVKSSGSNDRLGTSVSKIVDMENEINELIDEYIARKKIITNQIDKIEDDRYYNVLMNVYVHNWDFKKIAESMNYSVGNVKYLHKQALIEFEKMYSDEYRKVV